MTPDYIDDLANELIWTNLSISEGLRRVDVDPDGEDVDLDHIEQDLEAIHEMVRCPACLYWVYTDGITEEGDCGCQI